MGRQGSLLIPFLNDALIHEKYRNLKFEDASKRVLKLNLPQKTCRLDRENEMLLKDWFRLKGKKYKFSRDYTKAKQAIAAALKKSDYLEKVHNPNDHQLTYRILNDDEIQSKKKEKNSRKNVCKFDKDTESGYESAASPTCSNYNSSNSSSSSKINAVLKSVHHDHPFCYPPQLEFAVMEWESIPEKSIEQFVESTDFSCNGNGIQLIKEEDMYERNEFPADALSLSNDSKSNEKDELPYLCQEKVSVQDLLQIPSENLFFNYKVYEETGALKTSQSDALCFNEEKMAPFYVCRKHHNLGNMKMLHCEYTELPLLNGELVNSGELKIIFNEETLGVLEDCNIKELQFVDQDVLVILEPKVQ